MPKVKPVRLTKADLLTPDLFCQYIKPSYQRLMKPAIEKYATVCTKKDFGFPKVLFCANGCRWKKKVV